MDRRNFFRTVAAGAGALWLPSRPVFAADLTGARTLDLYRPDTKEHLALTYLKDGGWQPGAYEQICWHLRDIHVNRSARMDVSLIAVLDWIQDYLKRYGYTDPIHVLSGYRTPETNRKIKNASENSLHMKALAVDFRVPGLPTKYLGELVSWLSAGGVGVYNGSKFVHVDRGRIRVWRG